MNDQENNSSAQEKRSFDRWLPWVICLSLALVIGAVFGQTIRYDFVNYDDDRYIYNDPAVTRGLDLGEIGWTFTHYSGLDEWYPMTETSHMLDWQLYGPNAGGHHLTNVLLHTATAILLFLILQKMTRAIWRSAFVAAVFAVHPLRVESVAWVTERKDVLSGLFFMLTLWMWLRYVQERPNAGDPGKSESVIRAIDPRHWTPDYYLALIFFALGILSKAMVVSLPLLLLLLDYWPLNRMTFSIRAWRGLILEKTPFFLLSIGGCVATILCQPLEVVSVRGLTLPWRMGNSAMAYVDYLGHMIYPAGLALLYAHPAPHLPGLRVALSILVLTVISVGVLIGWRKYPYLLVGWLWYLVMFLPVIGTMQVGDQTRADRYTYLPQIGLAILITWGLAELFKRWRFHRVLLAAVAGVVLTALSADAYVQTKYWRNSVSLWTHTLVYTPQSYIAHCNLGIALANQGKMDLAIQQFNQALQIDPDDAKSISNLGKVLTSEGKLDEAIQDFNRALQIDPNDPEILNNLGVALAAHGQRDEAIRDLERALQLKPDYADASYDLGNLLATGGDLDDAIQNYRQALQVNPDFAGAHCNLGLALARQGDLDGAIQEYEAAVQLEPTYVAALNDLGGALTAHGDLDEAVEDYGKVLQLKPDDPDALNNYGVALARQSKPDEAVQQFQRALQINPNDPSTYNNLGITLISEGKKDEGIQNLQQALYLARGQGNFTLENSILKRLDAINSGQN